MSHIEYQLDLSKKGNFSSAYCVLDPFNHSYNPAKTVSSLEESGCSFHRAWDEGLRSILLNGLRADSDASGLKGLEFTPL